MRVGAAVAGLGIALSALAGTGAASASTEPEPLPSPSLPDAPMGGMVPMQNTGTFKIWTHIQDYGWTTMAGSKGLGLRLEGIRIYQSGDKPMCLRVHVATIGWQAAKCTSTSNRQITVGTEGRSLAIEAVEAWTPGYNMGLTAHIQNIGDVTARSTKAGGHVTVGTTGRGLRMEAISFAPYNW